MPTARQPSFGGVAQLFGDDDEETPAPTQAKGKARQASFGGVASLFGDDDDDDNGGFGATPAQSGRRAPSFGGVANLFGDDDDGAMPAPVAKTSGRKGARQASFGGVAALFGDDEDDAPGRVITKQKKTGARQASFGGVASLFSSADAEDETGPAQAPPKKKRDPSFSGVANLFGDSDPEEEEEEPVAAKTSRDGDGIAPLQAIPKTQGRTKKRDPSFGGVANLFADNDDDDDEDEDENNDFAKNLSIKPTVNNKLTTDLQVQVERHRSEVIELESNLNDARSENEKLRARIAELTAERSALVESKLSLIQLTSLEIDRMRGIMVEINTANNTAANKTANTVA